ncbi:MAG TPA: hypothetical protein VFI15_00610 [Candidatus Limnocylindrales bacterium]|nr:hypothetical protein [Candidatus Limnocylindrales bacterium]
MANRPVAPLVLVLVAMVAGCAAPGLAQPTAPSGSSQSGATEPQPSVMHDTPVGEPVPTAVGSPHPLGGSCASQATADRCQAMAFAAAQQLALPFDDIASIAIVPNPSPEAIDFAHRTFLSIGLADGSRQDVTISCPGVSGAYLPPCMTDPTVPIGFPRGSEGGGGYTDTPENATPFPSLDAQAVADARALTIAQMSVPISATGVETIVVGQAQLANGYLAEGDFAMADPWPSDVLFATGPRLEIRPIDGGPALQNLYEHGWQDGVEHVEATITFDVAWFEPGATLELVDIVVR